jgi:hypothetical protein
VEDYRAKKAKRYKTMRLTTDEFIRCFLLHVLPSGFHRIRHFGIFANPQRANTVQQIRLLLVPASAVTVNPALTTEVPRHAFICRTCKTPMNIIEVLLPEHLPRAPPAYCVAWPRVFESTQSIALIRVTGICCAPC